MRFVVFPIRRVLHMSCTIKNKELHKCTSGGRRIRVRRPRVGLRGKPRGQGRLGPLPRRISDAVLIRVIRSRAGLMGGRGDKGGLWPWPRRISDSVLTRVRRPRAGLRGGYPPRPRAGAARGFGPAALLAPF